MKRIGMKKSICLMLVLFIAGCSFPATKEGMIVTNYVAPKQTGERIFIKESTGGIMTLPFWASQIPNDNFTEAVKESLLNSKAFSALSTNWGDDWGLEIEILQVAQPFTGGTQYTGAEFTVTTDVTYRLYFKGKKVYETNIHEAGTATFSDSFWAAKRLRLANESSGRANVKRFIAELSNQKLD
jgi:outer membrane lipopolysaccharide assembly protein LptE/RlpB